MATALASVRFARAVAVARAVAAMLVVVFAAGCDGVPVGSGAGGRAGPDPAAIAAARAVAPGVPAGAFDASVVRVVDGDTFVARRPGGRAVRVRLIGVDTPETVRPGTPVRCFGHEASRYTTALLAGREVRAAYEPGGHHDRYGRELWDVWLPDGSFLAGLLAAGGYARAYPVRPQVVHARVLAGLAAAARLAGRGLWGPPCRGASFGRGP